MAIVEKHIPRDRRSVAPKRTVLFIPECRDTQLKILFEECYELPNLNNNIAPQICTFHCVKPSKADNEEFGFKLCFLKHLFLDLTAYMFPSLARHKFQCVRHVQDGSPVIFQKALSETRPLSYGNIFSPSISRHHSLNNCFDHFGLSSVPQRSRSLPFERILVYTPHIFNPGPGGYLFSATLVTTNAMAPSTVVSSPAIEHSRRRSVYWDTVLDSQSSSLSDQPSSSLSTSTTLSSTSSELMCPSHAPPLPPSPTLTRLTPFSPQGSLSETLDRPHPCPLCPSRFRQRSHLTAHYRVVHYKCKPFVCSYCNHSFGKKYDLKMHVAAVHFRLRAFSCDHCNKSFAKKSNLSRHQSHRHPGPSQ